MRLSKIIHALADEIERKERFTYADVTEDDRRRIALVEEIRKTLIGTQFKAEKTEHGAVLKIYFNNGMISDARAESLRNKLRQIKDKL